MMPLPCQQRLTRHHLKSVQRAMYNGLAVFLTNCVRYRGAGCGWLYAVNNPERAILVRDRREIEISVVALGIVPRRTFFCLIT